MRLISSIRLCATALTALFLTGCLVPEKFSASITIKDDGYVYLFEGTAINYFAAVSLKDNVKLSDADKRLLEREAAKSARDPGIKKMAYDGEGRYRVRIEQALKYHQEVTSIKLFNITRDKDGLFTVEPPPLDAVMLSELRGAPISLVGTASVFLPSSAKVVFQNADSIPGFFSNSYSWKVQSIDSKPKIQFKLD